MVFGLQKSQRDTGLLASNLFDQDSFYGSLMKDLLRAKHEVILTLFTLRLSCRFIYELFKPSFIWRAYPTQ